MSKYWTEKQNGIDEIDAIDFNTAFADIETDMQLKTGKTLEDAKAYAETKDAETLVSAKTYADTKDAENLESAKGYTDRKAPCHWFSDLDSTMQLSMNLDNDFADMNCAVAIDLSPIADSAKAYTDTECTKKVDKVSGKGLSKNDFTDALKTKLVGVDSLVTEKTSESLESAKTYADQIFKYSNKAVQMEKGVDYTTFGRTSATAKKQYMRMVVVNEFFFAKLGDDPENITLKNYTLFIKRNDMPEYFTAKVLGYEERDDGNYTLLFELNEYGIAEGENGAAYFRKVQDVWICALSNQLSDWLDEKADKSTKDGGFQGGAGANSVSTGAALGLQSYTVHGGSVGWHALSSQGGAVGMHTQTGHGFAGGYAAKTAVKEGNVYSPIDAVQLGTGLNSVPKSMQVYDFQMMDAEGNVPAERLKFAKSYTDEKFKRTVKVRVRFAEELDGAKLPGALGGIPYMEFHGNDYAGVVGEDASIVLTLANDTGILAEFSVPDGFTGDDYLEFDPIGNVAISWFKDGEWHANLSDGIAEATAFLNAMAQANSIAIMDSCANYPYMDVTYYADLEEAAKVYADEKDLEIKNCIYTECAKKVDKVSGKGLSQNDFTNALKTKVEGMDEQVSGALESAKAYADTKDAAALQSAKSYTDSAIERERALLDNQLKITRTGEVLAETDSIGVMEKLVISGGFNASGTPDLETPASVSFTEKLLLGNGGNLIFVQAIETHTLSNAFKNHFTVENGVLHAVNLTAEKILESCPDGIPSILVSVTPFTMHKGVPYTYAYKGMDSFDYPGILPFIANETGSPLDITNKTVENRGGFSKKMQILTPTEDLEIHYLRLFINRDALLSGTMTSYSIPDGAFPIYIYKKDTQNKEVLEAETTLDLSGYDLKGASANNQEAYDQIVVDYRNKTVKHVQRFKKFTFSANNGLTVKTLSAAESVNRWQTNVSAAALEDSYLGFCNILPFGYAWNDSAATDYPCIMLNKITAYFKLPVSYGTDVAAVKQMLLDKGFYFWYALAAPIETDITDTEVGQALLNLTLSKEFSVQTTGAGGKHELTYVRDLNTVISELQNAILALGGEL